MGESPKKHPRAKPETPKKTCTYIEWAKPNPRASKPNLRTHHTRQPPQNLQANQRRTTPGPKPQSWMNNRQPTPLQTASGWTPLVTAEKPPFMFKASLCWQYQYSCLKQKPHWLQWGIACKMLGRTISSKDSHKWRSSYQVQVTPPPQRKKKAAATKYQRSITTKRISFHCFPDFHPIIAERSV